MQAFKIEHFRYFLKDSIRQTIDFMRTDQNRGVTPPPLEKPFDSNAKKIVLSKKEQWKNIQSMDLLSAIERRKSHRNYLNVPLTLDELSFLLWATQGVRKRLSQGTALRNVPSAGSRHALETYLCVLKVTGLEKGIYRYLPVEHQLLLEFEEQQLSSKVVRATLAQAFTAKAAVLFAWTAIPYRMEWRYDLAAHKVIAIDAGHVGQNLYLACEAIGAGTCAIAAYHQELMDQLLHVDGNDEFAIYLAAVGKV